MTDISNDNTTPPTTPSAADPAPATPTADGAPPDRPDFLAAYDRAVHQLADVVGGLTPDQAGRSTPCTEYDVEHLVGHVLTGIRRAARVAVGGDPFGEVPIEVPAVDPAWGDQVRAEADASVETWTPADLEVVVAVPWGEVPGWAALAGYVQESTVHAWDLAVASRGRGIDLGLDPTLAELSIGVAGTIPDEARGEGRPFGLEQPAPAGADPYTRLAAVTGRPV